MSKTFIRGVLVALCTAALASCSNDNDEPQPTIDPVDNPALGFFVLNQGNYYSNIEGSLTYCAYASHTSFPNLFQQANKRSLGGTPQAIAVYGSHIYIGVYDSNTIEIVNRYTFASEKQISLSNSEGQSPRSIVADGKKVYISMYNGYVCRMDTTSLEIDATVAVGPNPEIMAIANGYLYVPNSDGMNYQAGYGTTASKIDLSTFNVVKTFEVGLNPTKFAANGKGDLFLLAMGNYYDVKGKVYKVNADESITEISEGTQMSCGDSDLYICNWPYGVDPVYYTYNYETAKTTVWTPSKPIDGIANIEVDPINGYVLLSSQNLDNGYPSYVIDGYVNQYTLDGTYIDTYPVGVYPCAMALNTPQ